MVPSERHGSVDRCVKARTLAAVRTRFGSGPQSHAARLVSLSCSSGHFTPPHLRRARRSIVGVRHSAETGEQPLPVPEGAFAVPFESSTIRKPFVDLRQISSPTSVQGRSTGRRLPRPPGAHTKSLICTYSIAKNTQTELRTARARRDGSQQAT